MKPIIAFFATCLTLVGLAQTSDRNLEELNISGTSESVTTTILQETEFGVAGYQFNTERGDLSVGIFDANFAFTSVAKKKLIGTVIEKVLVRESKILVFTSNNDKIYNQHPSKKVAQPKVSVDVWVVDLATKEASLKKGIVKLDFINNEPFFEGNFTIAESRNQEFLGICYGFKRDIGKDKAFTSTIVLLDETFQEVKKVVWEDERAKYEVKRYDDLLVSNKGEIYILTASNFSKKSGLIIPLHYDIDMRTREYENEFPGLTISKTGRQFHWTHQMEVCYVGADSDQPKSIYVDFEEKYSFTTYNGCKMLLDNEEKLMLAGLYSDAFSGITSQGIYLAQVIPESGELKILYKEFFSADFVKQMLPTEKNRIAAAKKIADGKHPVVEDIGIVKVSTNKDNELIAVFEYQFFDTKITFTNFKKNKSFVGNLAVMKFIHDGTELDWTKYIEKNTSTYNPQGLIGSNNVYVSSSKESGTTQIFYNERNPNQELKSSSVLGVDIDYPKLVKYEISDSGELSEKEIVIEGNAPKLIMRPERSITMGEAIVFQGVVNKVQQFFIFK